MPADSSDFETNPDGSIKVCPVVGWDTFIPFGMACGLRLHIVHDDQQLLSGRFDAVPLILTPAQARELAQSLNTLADRASIRPTDVSAN